MNAQFYITDDGASIRRKLIRRAALRMRSVPPFPRILQIQTLSGCNARCRFCPNTTTLGRLSMGRMEEDLFRRIIDEALEHRVRRISPYLMNEPLMDERLPDLIRYISDRKGPLTYTKINTNASLLTEEMGERLLASGLDRLHVSFHGIRKPTYEESMGNLSWEKTLQNVNRFLELKRRRKARKPHVKVTMVHTRTIDTELEEIRSYWNSRGVIVNIHALENRSSSSVENRALNLFQMNPLTGCDRLMQQAYILWNGDCVLCCVDWERTTVMGNVREASLKEVWGNEKYRTYRRNYLAGQVAGTLCQGCKVQQETDFSYWPRISLRGLLTGHPFRHTPLPPPDEDTLPERPPTKEPPEGDAQGQGTKPPH